MTSKQIDLLLGTASTADYPSVSVEICSSVTAWCRLSSSRGWTIAIRQSTLASVSSHLLLRLQSVMNAAPLSAALAEGPRADCIQTCCPSVQVYTLVRTLLASFVRWQMSRHASDSVPVHPHHWLSPAPDSLLLVTELSRSPLHVSGTVCQISSLPDLP